MDIFHVLGSENLRTEPNVHVAVCAVGSVVDALIKFMFRAKLSSYASENRTVYVTQVSEYKSTFFLRF